MLLGKLSERKLAHPYNMMTLAAVRKVLTAMADMLSCMESSEVPCFFDELQNNLDELWAEEVRIRRAVKSVQPA